MSELPPETMRLVMIEVSKIAMKRAHEQFHDPFDAARWTPKQIVLSVRSQFGDKAADFAASILTIH
jgi:hypothetical protein